MSHEQDVEGICHGENAPYNLPDTAYLNFCNTTCREPESRQSNSYNIYLSIEEYKVPDPNTTYYITLSYLAQFKDNIQEMQMEVRISNNQHYTLTFFTEHKIRSFTSQRSCQTTIEIPLQAPKEKNGQKKPTPGIEILISLYLFCFFSFHSFT